MRLKLWIALAAAGVTVVAGSTAIILLRGDGGTSASAHHRASSSPSVDNYSGPRHLADAERLVDHLTPGKPNPRNVYLKPGEKTVLSWGTNAPYRARAECTSFVVHVIKHSYPWATDLFFQNQFGDNAPPARAFFQKLATSTVPHFTLVDSVTALEPGDIIFVDYQNGATGNKDDTTTPSGHAAIIRRIVGVYPGQNGNQPGLVQYVVQVVDNTRSPHGTPTAPSYKGYPDTRVFANNVVGNGAGYGYMIFYADARTGHLSGYRWSPTDPTAHLTDHKIIAVRIAATQ
jgi:hypothetical protein